MMKGERLAASSRSAAAPRFQRFRFATFELANAGMDRRARKPRSLSHQRDPAVGQRDCLCRRPNTASTLIQNSMDHPVLLSQDDQLIPHAKRIRRSDNTFKLFMRRPLAEGLAKTGGSGF